MTTCWDTGRGGRVTCLGGHEWSQDVQWEGRGPGLRHRRGVVHKPNTRGRKMLQFGAQAQPLSASVCPDRKDRILHFMVVQIIDCE